MMGAGPSVDVYDTGVDKYQRQAHKRQPSHQAVQQRSNNVNPADNRRHAASYQRQNSNNDLPAGNRAQPATDQGQQSNNVPPAGNRYHPPYQGHHSNNVPPTGNRANPLTHQGQQKEESMADVLKAIDTIIKNWSVVIPNVRSEGRMDEEQAAYLTFEIVETGKEWNRISQSVAKTDDKQSCPNIQSHNPRSSVDSQLCSMQETIAELSKRLADKKERIKQQSEENEALRQRIREVEEKNSELITRLSKQASDRLLKNNPNITNLGDVNRPSKLGEIYSELYDNETTEAMIALTENGYTEREAIDTLRTTLLDTYKFCSDKALALLTSSEEAINTLFGESDTSENRSNKVDNSTGNHRPNARTLMPGEGAVLLREQTYIEDLKFALRWKPKNRKAEECVSLQTIQESNHGKIQTVGDEMKTMRKGVAGAIVPLVLKAYLRTRWEPDCIQDLKTFIEKCVFLSWMMNVQSPAMAFLEWNNDPGERFDSGRYRTYTESGTYIDYVVWPTLMLTKEGPIIVKGVAQGKR